VAVLSFRDLLHHPPIRQVHGHSPRLTSEMDCGSSRQRVERTTGTARFSVDRLCLARPRDGEKPDTRSYNTAAFDPVPRLVD